MSEFTGECLCGAVRYRIEAEAPKAMYLCHCTRCRKETGSIHCANVFFPDGRLTFERGGKQIGRFALEGTRKKRWFCQTCGSPVPRQDVSGMIVLPAGGLDDGSALTPTAHIFHESRAEWADRAGEAPKHEELP